MELIEFFKRLFNSSVFVGLGEKPDDIERFDLDVFVDALFD